MNGATPSELSQLTEALIEGFDQRLNALDVRVEQRWSSNNRAIQDMFNSSWNERNEMRRFMAEMRQALLESQRTTAGDIAETRALYEENDRKDREARRRETDTQQTTWQERQLLLLTQLEARLTQRGLLLALLLVALAFLLVRGGL